jgi:hypothetical protein
MTLSIVGEGGVGMFANEVGVRNGMTKPTEPWGRFSAGTHTGLLCDISAKNI